MLDGSDQPDTRDVESLCLDFENCDRMLKETSPLVNTLLAGKSFDAPTALVICPTPSDAKGAEHAGWSPIP